MENLKRLLEEAETVSSEYAAQLEKKRRAEQEEEEKWKQEENHLGLDSTGGLAKGVSFFFFLLKDVKENPFHFINRVRIWQWS